MFYLVKTFITSQSEKQSLYREYISSSLATVSFNLFVFNIDIFFLLFFLSFINNLYFGDEALASFTIFTRLKSHLREKCKLLIKHIYFLAKKESTISEELISILSTEINPASYNIDLSSCSVII